MLGKKVLYTASVEKHITAFHLPYLKWFKDSGFEVHVAFNASSGIRNLPYVDHIWNIPFHRSPFSAKNIYAYKLIKEVIDNNHYNLIHCHTPAESVITRIASQKARGKGTLLFYTAHGFYFYKGAPLKNWLLFFTLEKILSFYSDCIITINKEDYNFAKKYFSNISNNNIYYISGIGVNSQKFKPVSPQEKSLLRLHHGYKESDFILLYIAEFIPRKNHHFILKSLVELKKNIPNIKVLFAGTGVLLKKTIDFCDDQNLNDCVNFLGWRDDLAGFAALADVGISSSKMEGFGLGLAEEMLCSIPIVATYDRGHKEMIDQGINGYMFQHDNVHEFVKYINQLYLDEPKRLRLGQNALIKGKKFVIEKSLKSMVDIYNKFLE